MPTGVIILVGQLKKNKVILGVRAPSNIAEKPGPNSNKKGGNSKPRTKEATKRQAMLNTHRINPFKYDMNEILSTSSMDPSKASSFLATVIAKASRVSTKDAKEFVKTFLDSGDLTKDEHDRINRLLDRYSKFR